MARYTDEFLAAARHGYETTDQPMRELARELGIGITTLSTLAEKHGWLKRSQRARGLRPDMRLLAETRALMTGSANRLGVGGERTPTATLPLAGGGSAPSPAAGDGQQDPPHLEQTSATLTRIERILERLLAAEEAALAQNGRSPQSARTLATLTQVMNLLRQMRGGTPIDTGPIDDDDDMPRDIDEFRRDLARRIAVFMESRPDDGDAGNGGDAAPLDQVR